MKKAIKFILLLGVPMVLLVMIASGAFHEKIVPGVQAQGGSVVSGVKIQSIKLEKVPTQIQVTGTVKANQVAMLSTKLMVHVLEVKVSEGSHVKKGQILVKLDPREVQLQREQARAAQEQAQAALNQNTYAEQEAQAGKQVAEAEYNNALTSYERYKSLYSDGAVSQQDLENTEMRYKATTSTVNQAEARIAYVSSQKGQILAQLKVAQAGVEMASVVTDYATINAPFDGIVTKKSVEVGDLNIPGQSLFVIEEEPYYLEAAVQESLSEQIKVGQEVKVSLEAVGKEITGKIMQIIPVVDPSSRTFIAKIYLPNTIKVISGMYGKVFLPVGEKEKVMISENALIRWSQFTGVYLVNKENRAYLQYVTTGQTIGDMVEIASGLEPGERIIVEGKEQVQNGDKVEVKK